MNDTNDTPRHCIGQASDDDTCAACTCGWSHHGPGADAALTRHLYGDLSPRVRRWALTGRRAS